MLKSSVSVGTNRLLWVLLGLSIFDAFATDFGLRFELIVEANLMMDYVYESSVIGFYFVKLSLPISLFTLQSVVARSRFVQRLLQFTIGLYAVISGLHVFWLVLQFS
ncbi:MULTISPECIES: DUF5658 family protein [unclassified Sporosarcina]|uniref:DUF5658 family protein n=1 Tax=unclassified Sporosarcina TaxID=2647733 RepID=UPI00068A4CEF|nr:DUF5658 family protein [Sporosarcina sp. ZBG7A]VDG97131.1 Uncharacterised protein [Lysinibacillus sphaericus]